MTYESLPVFELRWMRTLTKALARFYIDSSDSWFPWYLSSIAIYRRIPFSVALKYKHGACAALLNPSSAEPLVWPSPLKFISELNPEAKVLLEKALMDANREREKEILKAYALPSPFDGGVSDDASEVLEFFNFVASSFSSSIYIHLNKWLFNNVG